MRTRFALGCLSLALVAGSAKADPIADAPPAEGSASDAPPTAPAATGDQTNATASSVASPTTPTERTAKNALYVEGLGPGLLYSFNYERMFGDFSARIGFEYLSVSASSTSASGTEGGSSSASFLGVPITLNYLGVGSKRNMLELGVGATIFHVGAGASAFDTDSKSSDSASATFVLPTAIVGYRFQPPDGGFLFRAGLSPVFAGSSIPILPWPYIALGGAFGP